MKTARRLAAACAVVALLLACLAGDSPGALSDDAGDDDVAAAFDLSTVLPAARGEPQLTLSPCGAVFVDDQSPSGHLPKRDIFRPPQRRA